MQHHNLGMIVHFIKDAPKRYKVRVAPVNGPVLEMSPAPGYDDDLPHDILHMVVEGVLGLQEGVFDQLSAGGDAGTFRIVSDGELIGRELARATRKLKERGRRLAKSGGEESSLSENVSYLCWREWLRRSLDSKKQRVTLSMTDNALSIQGRLSSDEQRRLDASLDEICAKLSAFWSQWSTLKTGESLTVTWPDLHIEDAA